MSTKKSQTIGCLHEETRPTSQGKVPLTQDAAANAAQRIETTLTLREALQYYHKAIAWSLAVSTATIMESYDLMLIGSFFAFPPFQRKFGIQLPNGSWSIPARWQLALGMVTNCGLILGVFANGYCADRWGFRKVLMASHAALIALIFINFFAPSVEVLTAGTFLMAAATRPKSLCAASSRRLRRSSTAGHGGHDGTHDTHGERDEHPWVVGRLLPRRQFAANRDLHDQLGLSDTAGIPVQNYITYFFTLAGLSPADSFYMSIVKLTAQATQVSLFLGTVTSFFLMTKLGWRTVYLAGLAAMLPLMSLVGFLALAPANPAVRWAQSALLLIWFLVYGLSIGPIPYGIAAAVGATNLRVKTISLGRNTYYILNIVNTVVAPYLLNPQEANLQGKAAFPAAGLTLMLTIWAWFRLPELKGLTGETLDSLFERKVPTRQFLRAAKELQHVR
ncbi:general alpha-glucoside permease [Verticillium alfalfae VaMs.102]|uniref:General alpha-glucoside permease n=1 Tax=Verticillium alfalfae (strain VaMs.102 / ATCC MYA-4576 / FGSC 10136) TaxID=526221 RepID=C9SJD7_VERA1|nr:general alpha-glucoside permease [Verticillium alfalfae VaMs.102]EEY18299.1 general alpha-glucoside permease [Verticillium alfalfae VaMs.102]